jgi:hypothetical protein
MNKPGDKNAKLLAETFHGEWTSGAPADLARAAAAHARRRRSVRQALMTATAGVALVAVGLTVWPKSAVLPAPATMATTKLTAVATRGYEIISDDELLARLVDQPLLVVKRANGTKEITLIEDSPVEAGAFDE